MKIKDKFTSFYIKYKILTEKIASILKNSENPEEAFKLIDSELDVIVEKIENKIDKTTSKNKES